MTNEELKNLKPGSLIKKNLRPDTPRTLPACSRRKIRKLLNCEFGVICANDADNITITWFKTGAVIHREYAYDTLRLWSNVFNVVCQ